MRIELMKHIAKWAVVAMVALVLAGCGNAFHNGTQMNLTSVTVKGLPSSPYAPGTQLYFDLCLNQSADLWVHSNNFAYVDAPKFLGTVDASGTFTVTFSPAMVVTSATIKFLLIDNPPNWNVLKVDKKHSGKSGGDVVLDNPWSTTALVGTVKGDDVNWNFE
jgi:hypothetical protein